ncbi:MAG: zinc metalloprotease HtpX [bacterium]|nr:zinc metalloprotease HtpX [bacterium]
MLKKIIQMASLYTHQERNIWKTWVLMTLFFVVVIAIGWAFSYVYDNPGILYFAVIFSIVMNIISYWYSDKIVLAMYKAVPVTNTSHPDLYNIVENLSITAGLPMPRVYVIPEAAPNAFATGRNKEHAAVAVTEGLLRMLDRSELEGVIAHELAHIGNRDTLLQTVIVILVGFVALISDWFIRMSFWGGHRDRGNGKAGGVLVLIGFALAILAPIIATLIQLAISRRREFLADATGALMTRYPEGLANALRKIGGYAGEMRRANNATAHLFISNPFGPEKLHGLHKLFMTHPPMEDRVKALLGERA